MGDLSIVGEVVLSVGWVIVITILSLPMLRSISDLLTSIGMYHEKENWIVRIGLLYKNYTLVSGPIIFAIFTMITATKLVNNIFDAGLIALGSYGIFPITIRVLSLSKKPELYDVARINWKLFETQSKERQSRETKDSMKRLLLYEKKERYISSAFSIIFVGWILYIIILPVYMLIYHSDGIGFYETMASLNGSISYSESFGLVILFFTLPLLYALIGEFCLKLSGVDDLMKIPSK